MAREVTHYQQFEAALETIQPNFPPAILQTSPKYSNLYFNLSKGGEARGPWNEGPSSQLGEEWQYIECPKDEVQRTNGLVNREPKGTHRTEEGIRKIEKKLAKERSEEIFSTTPKENMCWSKYDDKKCNKK